MAAIIGLVLAVAAAFILEYIDDTIKTPDEVRTDLNLPTVGTITRIEGKDYPNMLVVSKYPLSPAAEAYRVLRTNLQFSSIEHPLRTLVVTSTRPQEGKSVTAANLATIIAQSGKRETLVDSDLRRPTMHKVFQVSNATGLTSLLLDAKAHPQDYMKEVDIENLMLLPSGPMPPNPSELLGSRRMSDMIEALKSMSDVVIFDAPPIVSVADAAILSTHADSVLMVVDSGRTRRALAQIAKDRLATLGAPLLGVVLNRLSARHAASYYDYYYAPQDRPRARKRGLLGRLGNIFDPNRRVAEAMDVTPIRRVMQPRNGANGLSTEYEHRDPRRRRDAQSISVPT